MHHVLNFCVVAVFVFAVFVVAVAKLLLADCC